MSNNYKDASERLAEELRSQSFNDMVYMVNGLLETNSELREQLYDAAVRIEELETEPLVVQLREQLAAMESVAEMWVDIANDLFEGLLIAEEQLMQRGIGLRPVAQTAKKLFLEMTEEDED